MDCGVLGDDQMDTAVIWQVAVWSRLVWNTIYLFMKFGHLPCYHTVPSQEPQSACQTLSSSQSHNWQSMAAQAHKAHTWVTCRCLLIYFSDYLTSLVGSLNLQNKHLLSPPVHPSSKLEPTYHCQCCKEELRDVNAPCCSKGSDAVI
jgi:hypothetical protein